MGAGTDVQGFVETLARAVAAEVRARRAELAERTVRSIALDVHPWHGHIGLAVLTDLDPSYASVQEQREEMAAWVWFEFARRGEPWAAVAEIAAEMKRESPVDPESSQRWLEAAARALDHEVVTAALRGLTLSDDFERFVGDPDDSSLRNLCRLTG